MRIRAAARIVIVLACVSLALTACGERGEDGGPAAGGGSALEGRTFAASALDDPEQELVEASTITLEFTHDNLALNAGCNSIGGAYEVEDDHLVATQLGGTEMGCDAELMAQDTWLIGFLSARPRVMLDGDELTLSTARSTLRLDADSTSATPLEGTVWRLDSLVEGTGPDATVASVPRGVGEGRLVIERGTLRLTYGCTTLTSPVEVSAAQLRAGEVSMARRDCAPRLAGLQRQVARVLEPPSAFVVTGRNLMLSSSDGASGLGFVAE